MNETNLTTKTVTVLDLIESNKKYITKLMIFSDVGYIQ